MNHPIPLSLKFQSKRRQRRGTTIIELMGLIGLLMATAMAAYRSLGTVTRLSHQNQIHRLHRTEIDRLARIFRSDTGNATKVDIQGHVVDLVGDQGDVRYEFRHSDSSLYRTQSTGTQAVSVDRFRMRPGFNMTMEVHEPTEGVDFLRFKIASNSSSGSSAHWIMESAIGADK